MQTYNLITTEETHITGISISSTSYTIPVDDIGSIPSDYLKKFRIIKDNQMLVFDSEQEYRDWLQQNT